MNIKTTKQVSLLALFSLLAACSTNNTTTGNQSRFGGQLSPGSQNNGTTTNNSAGSQNMPGSQWFNRQNNTTKRVTTNNVQSLPKAPERPKNMRKIVMKAPPKPARTTNFVPKTLVKQSRSNVGVTTSAPKIAQKPVPVKRTTSAFTPAKKVVNKPAVTQPYRAPTIAKPVRSAKPAPRPVAKKPQNSVRRLTLNGSANFKSGSSKLTQEGQTKLLALSLTLQEGSTKISRLTIEGHTDSVGDAAMNQVLSLKRANAVAEYLSQKGGFPRSIIQTVGMGEGKPIASNKTRKGRAQNRRVEIMAIGTRQIQR